MLEKDIENLIARYPEEFFPDLGFRLIKQEVKVSQCHANIIFKDKYNRIVIIEVKRGILSRDMLDQIVEHYDLFKQVYPTETVNLVLCANFIPRERKIFLKNLGIDCKELNVASIINLAKKYKYRFIDTKKEKYPKSKKDSSIKPNNKQKVWIFQANPSRYDILNALLDHEYREEVWTVNQHKNDINEGDIALIWVSGKGGGIYAIANIISEPAYIQLLPEEEQYWTSDGDKGKSRLRVKIIIRKNLINNPLFRSELKGIKALTSLSILRFPQGTNFPVTDSEWKIIESKINDKIKNS